MATCCAAESKDAAAILAVAAVSLMEARNERCVDICVQRVQTFGICGIKAHSWVLTQATWAKNRACLILFNGDNHSEWQWSSQGLYSRTRGDSGGGCVLPDEVTPRHPADSQHVKNARLSAHICGSAL